MDYWEYRAAFKEAGMRSDKVRVIRTFAAEASEEDLNRLIGEYLQLKEGLWEIYDAYRQGIGSRGEVAFRLLTEMFAKVKAASDAYHPITRTSDPTVSIPGEAYPFPIEIPPGRQQALYEPIARTKAAGAYDFLIANGSIEGEDALRALCLLGDKRAIAHLRAADRKAMDPPAARRVAEAIDYLEGKTTSLPG